MVKIKLKLAFTLIELLVVIAIIGILSGLIIVTMDGVTQKANIAKSQIFSNSLRNSLMLNLVSEWKLDENSGVSIVDSWGTNTGTLMENSYVGACDSSHCPQFKTTDCIYKNCLSFDGINDYISTASVTHNLNTGATFSFWSKKNIEHNGIIFGNNSTGANKRIIFLTNDRLYFETNTDGDYCAGMPSLDTNWHYYVITATETRVLFYEDCSDITVDGTVVNSIVTFDRISGPSYYFNGKLDDIRVYNAVMPISQIKEQYYAGLNSLLINGNISSREYAWRTLDLNNVQAKR